MTVILVDFLLQFLFFVLLAGLWEVQPLWCERGRELRDLAFPSPTVLGWGHTRAVMYCDRLTRPSRGQVISQWSSSQFSPFSPHIRCFAGSTVYWLHGWSCACMQNSSPRGNTVAHCHWRKSQECYVCMHLELTGKGFITEQTKFKLFLVRAGTASFFHAVMSVCERSPLSFQIHTGSLNMHAQNVYMLINSPCCLIPCHHTDVEARLWQWWMPWWLEWILSNVSFQRDVGCNVWPLPPPTPHRRSPILSAASPNCR